VHSVVVFLILLDLRSGAPTFLSFHPRDLRDGAAHERDGRVDVLPARDPCPSGRAVAVDAWEIEASTVSAT
jgi:hypothetical protein